MGFHYVAFFFEFAILVSVNAMNSPSFAVENNSSRLLRTDDAVANENEERFTSKIEAFKSIFTSKSISDDMINRWLNEKKSVDQVFAKLNLKYTSEDKLFEHPRFITWINYVKSLNAETGGPSWLAISKLTEYYGDATIAMVIEAAKKKPGMEKLTSDLQTQQYLYWLNGYFPRTLDDVFKTLGLGFAKKKLLENRSKNPLFLIWLDYVKFYNTHSKYMKEGYLSTLATKFRYNDDEISGMIHVARETPSTMDFAKILRAEQVNRWYSSGWSPSKVWRYLRYDVVGDNVLASQEFKILSKYVDGFNKKYPDKKTTAFSVLSGYFSDTSSKAILAALTSKTQGTENIANQVETALIKFWLTKYDPTQVFAVLKLSRSPEKLLENPLLSTWGKYLGAFNAKYPEKRTTAIGILRTQFGDVRLSKMLVEAKTVPTSKDLAVNLEKSLLSKLATEARQPSCSLRDGLLVLKASANRMSLKMTHQLFQCFMFGLLERYLHREFPKNEGVPASRN